MDIVSFETATRLKEAGFPQPEPEIAQIWYFYKERRFVCDIFPLTQEYNEESIYYHKFGIYAPTFTDILSELSKTVKGKGIVRVDVSSHNGGENDDTPRFSVSIFPGHDDFAISPNPVELAAITWLSIHEKKI